MVQTIFMTTFMFEMMGAVYNKSDLFGITKETLKECRHNIDDKLLKKTYDEFVNGNIDENYFWKKLSMDNYMMPRKLILEKIENSLNNDFLEVLPSLSGNRIVIKGDIPQEWGEHILESTTVSSMIQSYVFSGSLGKNVNDSEFIKTLINKLGSLICIETNKENYIKLRDAGADVILLVREPTTIDGLNPEITISNLRQIEEIFRT